MEPVLIKTQGEVEAMIINIDKDKRDAAETQTVVAAEEEAAQTKAAETKAIADDAQRDLDEALPALEEAVKCLNSLKKSDIDEVRTMGKPPAGALRVLASRRGRPSAFEMETRRIDEVRALRSPRTTRHRRAGVKLTMEACCIMFSVKPEMEKNPDGVFQCP